ncbi:hypothetical protein Q8F55_006908 [Vanrija albida]|uniref:Uncharacterized protein n=1 Tax=Vanrija albida TaxID=181172 RepID=A0ABR3PYD5_9TREE
MVTFKGDTALEVGTALARVDLNDRASFNEAVQVVKTYVRAKMKKSKNDSVALPGGKLEALERKYALIGFADVFYLVRLELQLPPSALALPRPSSPVRRQLLAAKYPLPPAYQVSQSEDDAVSTRASTSTTSVPSPQPDTRVRPDSALLPSMSALSAHAHSPHSPHPYAASASGSTHDEHDRGRDSRSKSIHSSGRSVYSQESSEIGGASDHHANGRMSATYPSSPLQKPATPRSVPIPTSSSHPDIDRDFFDLDAAEMHQHQQQPAHISRSGSLRSAGKSVQQPPPVPPPPGRPPPVPRSTVAPPTPELVSSMRARSNTQTSSSSANSSAMPTPQMVSRRPSDLYRRPSDHGNLPYTSSPLIHPVDYSQDNRRPSDYSQDSRRPSAESALSSSPYMMATRGRKHSTEQPTSPLALVSEEKRPLGRSDADIRALFDALPPEAQEMAARRLAEQQQRLEEEKLQAKKAREEQRRLEALLAEQRRRERDEDARREEQRQREARKRALQPADLLDTRPQPGGETPPNGREPPPPAGQTPVSPTRPPGTEGLVDTDVRRMIEARIKALQTALEGLEEGPEAALAPAPTPPPAAAGTSPPSASPYPSRGPPAPSSQYSSRAELQHQYPVPAVPELPPPHMYPVPAVPPTRPAVAVAVPVPAHRRTRISPHRSSPHSPHSPHSVSSLMFELDDGSPTGSNGYKGLRTPPPEYNTVDANPNLYRGGRI